MARVRVVPRRSRRLVHRLWLAERRTFRHGLIALTVASWIGVLVHG